MKQLHPSNGQLNASIQLAIEFDDLFSGDTSSREEEEGRERGKRFLPIVRRFEEVGEIITPHRDPGRLPDASERSYHLCFLLLLQSSLNVFPFPFTR